jgi:hypothetical protein
LSAVLRCTMHCVAVVRFRCVPSTSAMQRVSTSEQVTVINSVDVLLDCRNADKMRLRTFCCASARLRSASEQDDKW